MGSTAQDSAAASGNHEYFESALKDAHDQYAKLNPKSQEAHEEACRYLPGGNTRTVLHTTPFPMTIVSGQSCMLKSLDGHQYVDFLGEYTAGIYGHNNRVIRKAIDQALDNGWNYGGHNVMEKELAKIVCERFPAMEKVRFVNSGTEANMMALATALAFTGKKKILVFEKGYHGSTISGKTTSGKPSINLPHEFVVAPYNDLEATLALVDNIPEDSLAAILVEPMLGSGGCFPGTTKFLMGLRSLATSTNALLILDEVMTSRLSYHGYGHESGIYPDLMTIGKWVGGGMSFGAFGGREDVMGLFDPRKGQLDHPGTFNNNVLSMSAGIAGCTLLTREVIDDLNKLGVEMRESLHAVSFEFHKGDLPIAPVVEDGQGTSKAHKFPKMYVTGEGSLMNIHFSGPEKDVLQGLFFHHMLGEGFYLAQRGFIALSIEITQQHVDAFVDAVCKFCDIWEADLR